MHPGNIFVLKSGIYSGVDFGIMGTLSDEDRAIFLKARGLKDSMTPEETATLLALWPDDEILMAIGSGLF